MKVVHIKKKSGGSRLIYVPNETEKVKLQSMMSNIDLKSMKLCPEGIVHGFTRKKSPVTNAIAHIGHAFTTCFDLKDFFDSVSERHLKGKLTDEQLRTVLVDGAPRQGLPTSPAVANLAASDLDKAILTWRDKHKLQLVYTRYADDLSFSYDDPTTTPFLLKNIPQIVGRCGFKVNANKTRTMSASNGRRRITGIAVGEDKIYPTREMKRKLRAARHQRRKNQSKGLAEWCRLKLPKIKEKNPKHIIDDEVKRLAKTWRLYLPKYLPKKKPDEKLANDTIISGDHCLMMGMSTFTTGWTSCMSQPSGTHRKGVMFWVSLRGTRIAAFLSNRTKIYAGVERRVMRARCLVHELRNGKMVYDRVYGNQLDTDHLKKTLEQKGYISVSEAKKRWAGEAVVGHVLSKIKPYFDNLHAVSKKASNGPLRGKQVFVAKI